MQIRTATHGDAAAIAPLLEQLGHPSTEAQVVARLKAMPPGEDVLVSEDEGRITGVASLHLIPVIHEDAPVAMLTSLVVDESERGRGVGRALVMQAEALAAARGATRMILTSRMSRIGAHAFYERLGFDKTSYRFTKTIR